VDWAAGMVFGEIPKQPCHRAMKHLPSIDQEGCEYGVWGEPRSPGWYGT